MDKQITENIILGKVITVLVICTIIVGITVQNVHGGDDQIDTILIKSLYSNDRDRQLDALKELQRIAPAAEKAILDIFWLVDQPDVGIAFNAMRAIDANLPAEKQLEDIIIAHLLAQSDEDAFTTKLKQAVSIFNKIWSGQLGLIKINQDTIVANTLAIVNNSHVNSNEKMRALHILETLIESNPTMENHILEELTTLASLPQTPKIKAAIEQIITIITSPGKVEIVNANQWYDTEGQQIHAHSSGVIEEDGIYYWFGEFRKPDWNFKAIRMYKSTDLKNWEFVNDVLTENSHPDLEGRLIERPKIIYNDQTGQYVMWMHWENGVHYGEARAAVAVCETIDGDYRYLDSCRPLGHMSRDCTLFKDDNGTAYFISAAQENYDLNFYRLTDDYLEIDELVHVIVGQHREAPAIFKENGYYFLVTSPCHGWSPGQSAYAYTTDIESGQWSPLYNIGNNTTYESQGNYILPIRGNTTTSYLFMADRHGGAYGRHPNTSEYVWFKLELTGQNSLSINWYPKLEIDTQTGMIRKAVLPTSQGQNLRHSQGTYLSATADGNYFYMSEEPTIEADWETIAQNDQNNAWVYIKHTASDRYLSEHHSLISLTASTAYSSEDNILWQLQTDGSYINFINKATGNYLSSWPYGADLSGKSIAEAESSNIRWTITP